MSGLAGMNVCACPAGGRERLVLAVPGRDGRRTDAAHPAPVPLAVHKGAVCALLWHCYEDGPGPVYGGLHIAVCAPVYSPGVVSAFHSFKARSSFVVRSQRLEGHV